MSPLIFFLVAAVLCGVVLFGSDHIARFVAAPDKTVPIQIFIGVLAVLAAVAPLVKRNKNVESNHPPGLIPAFLANPTPIDSLLQPYLRVLRSDCNTLPLATIDPKFSEPGQEVKLTCVYTDLNVLAAPVEHEEKGRDWVLRLMREEEAQVNVLEAMARPESRLAVLLGDPGSGKTTFVHYLGLRLAGVALGEGAADDLASCFERRLPIRLVLRELTGEIPANDAEGGNAELIWLAIKAVLKPHLNSELETVFPSIQARLARDGLFLLDGLDEVPEQAGRRGYLLRAIQNFSDSLSDGARVVVTARPYAYAAPRSRLKDFAQLTLAPLNRRQINAFVGSWYTAMQPVMRWGDDMARERGGALRQALDEKPYLADLASRPLLLTLIAALHASRSKLPEDRAELYEESVKLLLHRWQNRLDSRGAAGKRLLDPEIADAMRDAELLRAGLERLAYVTHERQGQQTNRDELPADISESEVLGVLAQVLPLESANPKRLLPFLDYRAGLLVGKGDGTFAFVHRSFQEYLAACHLLECVDDSDKAIKGLVCRDTTWWREVFLLAVGKLRQGSMGVALDLLNTLQSREVEMPRQPAEQEFQAALLVGLGLRDLRILERALVPQKGQALVDRTKKWLVALLEQQLLSTSERAEAGNVLSVLGDPRSGVRLRPDGLPDIAWVEIPAGPFTMGSAEDDQDAYDHEKPTHPLDLPAYRIARYPITNAQYRPFVEAGGYGDERYWSWSEAALAWRDGADYDLDVIKDESLKQAYQGWLATRPKEKRRLPLWWNDPKWGAASRPVVGVSWYEAQAYCRWLDEQLHAAGQLNANQQVALPSEALWEKAARGEKGLKWPWGNPWKTGLANTEEAGLGETSPVGLFPQGASPYGVEEMGGNVWEWCSSRWGANHDVPDFGYPSTASDGREDPQAADLRLLRGGSWFGDQRFARCAFRNRNIPGYYFCNLGFRVVVVSLVDSES